MKKGSFTIGLAGAGSIAHTHAWVFKSLPDVEVLAVAEPVEDRRKAFAEKYEIEKAVDDYSKLMEMDELDAIVVCLPNSLHAPAAVDAMKAGKHVLVEKPMALDAESALKMVEAQKETGKTLMVTLQGRYGTGIQLAHKYAREHLGQIYYGRCAFMRRSGIPGWGSWFTRKDMAGGGPCADIGVHALDRCLYLMGYPKPVSVAASTYSMFGPEGRGKGDWGIEEPDGYFDVEDLASAFIRFENGATVILEASWASHWPNRYWVEVLGTEGGITCSDRIKIFTDQLESPIDITVEAGKDNGSLNMSKHFIECCRTGKTPDTSAWHGLILNKIFDAVYQSAANNGKQVEID